MAELETNLAINHLVPGRADSQNITMSRLMIDQLL